MKKSELVAYLEEYWKDSQRRAKDMAKQGFTDYKNQELIRMYTTLGLLNKIKTLTSLE